jgi:hypothetical protein
MCLTDVELDDTILGFAYKLRWLRETVSLQLELL